MGAIKTVDLTPVWRWVGICHKSNYTINDFKAFFNLYQCFVVISVLSLQREVICDIFLGYFIGTIVFGITLFNIKKNNLCLDLHVKSENVLNPRSRLHTNIKVRVRYMSFVSRVVLIAECFYVDVSTHVT